jgi:hypothetical protein
MNARQAEEKIYRTDTARQLVAALIESRDQTDIRHVFDYHQGGSKGFEIASQRLGIQKAIGKFAMKKAGFYALVAIIAEKLGVPRYDAAAEKRRREAVAGLIKSTHNNERAAKTIVSNVRGVGQGVATRQFFEHAANLRRLCSSFVTLFFCPVGRMCCLNC